MLDVRLIGPGAGSAVGVAAPDAAPTSLGELRDEAGRLARAADAPVVTLHRPGLAGPRLSAFVEGLVLGDYSFDVRPATGRARRIDLSGVDDRAAVDAGLHHAGATVWARDLANMPANIKTPDWLARTAAARLTDAGVSVTVHDEAWLAAQGFGGVLAVAAGSVSPPRFVQASWRPRGARRDVHVVLVGKGITYDTGGLNLKPGESMKTMQTDMSGAAATFGALLAIAQARVPVRVTVLVPSAENSFSGSAMRPGDVIRHVGGRTCEVTNTDAEGRLVLADALAYAVARLRPTVLIDIATLTGGIKVALGMRTAGLFATDDGVADGLLAAASAAGEPLWRMPLPSDYESALASDVADCLNSPGNPQAVTAALWLRHFAGSGPWAHLDIAGPARSPKPDGVINSGATGFGTRLLARYVESLAS